MKIIFSLFFLFLNFSIEESKAQQDHVFLSDDKSMIIINGPISETTARYFETWILTHPQIDGVLLNSPGGLALAALKIADSVNKRGLFTYIPEKRYCLSACSLIFFAGTTRLAEGALGVHQFSNTNAAGAQLIFAATLDAFERYGVHKQVTRLMLRTLPTDIHIFTNEEKEKYGINRLKSDYMTLPEIESAKGTDYSRYPPDSYFGRDEKIVLPDFLGRDSWARNYRTRIRNGLSEGPNFSGHYRIIEIGCGMLCSFAYVANAKNGEVFDFPFGGEENLEMNLLYTINSKLVKVTWVINHDTCIQKDIIFDGRKFKIINESEYKRDGLLC